MLAAITRQQAILTKPFVKKGVFLAFGIFFLLLVCFISLSFVNVNFFSPLFGFVSTSIVATGSVLLGTLSFLVVGFTQPIAGAAMQYVTRNEMASPFTLGVSSSAMLAYVLVRYVWVIESYQGQFFAMCAIGCAAAFLILLVVNYLRVPPATLIVFGIAVSSLLSLATYVIQNNKGISTTVFQWVSSEGINYTWENFRIAVPLMLGCSVLIVFFARQLTIYRCDAFRARTLGINVQFMRTAVSVLSVIATVSASLMVGPLVFVGLIIPAIAKAIVRSANFVSVAAIGGLIGAILMVLCNILNTSYPSIPQNTYATMIGFFGLPFLFLKRFGNGR